MQTVADQRQAHRTIPNVTRSRRSRAFLISIPERVFRAGAALLGGSIHETGALLLPRLVRRSKLYEATAANLLRITVELVGGVEGAPTARGEDVGKIAVRKGAGNVVELGSIAAFGFSPLWLLAGASDVLRGSRVYLEALVEELRRAHLVRDDLDVSSVDELLDALERGSGRTAGLIDMPPVELEGLRTSLKELRADAASLPTPSDLAGSSTRLRRTAAAEERSLLEVSAEVGLAFLTECADAFHASTWSFRTGRIGSRSGARASRPTPAVSPGLTAAPSPGTSTLRARAWTARGADWFRRQRSPT